MSVTDRSRWSRVLRVWTRRHPRSVAASVAVALGGFTVTAFGVAPLAPDAADLPSLLITQTIEIPSLDEQQDALDQHRLALYRSDTTRAGDTADSLMRRLGADDPAFAAFLRRDAVARSIVEGRPGKLVRAEVDDRGRVLGLVARYPKASVGVPTEFHRLVVARSESGWTARVEVGRLEAGVRVGSGVIASSLFAAVDEADIPDAIASQMVEMFSADIDFHRQLRRGDRFSVVYEGLMADGEPVAWNGGAGRVLAAEFVNRGRTHTALWFEGADGKGGYFDLEGQNRRRSFLASPLPFSRVTSGFAMRLHPILNTWRAHRGIDYGAPTGTPVRTVGDGVVTFAGWQGGYGNVVEVQHAQGRSTLYAHLSRIDVKRGQSVAQGSTIGAVGATGWATGPHLHFEFKVRGQQVDPTSLVQQAEVSTVATAEKPRFQRVSGVLRSKLELARSLEAGASGG